MSGGGIEEISEFLGLVFLVLVLLDSVLKAWKLILVWALVGVLPLVGGFMKLLT